MSRGEFLGFLIDSLLSSEIEPSAVPEPSSVQYVTPQELRDFEHGMKELLWNFLDFVVTYGLELGKGSGKSGLKELSQRLRDI